MKLNHFGAIVQEEWLRTAEVRKGVVIDALVVMPNHLHGIIIITEKDRATRWVAPTTLQPSSVGSIIGQFKSVATRNIQRTGLVDFRWQRNYYEHVIRNDLDLNAIRQYVADNPAYWAADEENLEYKRQPFCRGDLWGRQPGNLSP